MTWPLPIMMPRIPKEWSCPKEIRGKRTEDYWHSQQGPTGIFGGSTAPIRWTVRTCGGRRPPILVLLV